MVTRVVSEILESNVFVVGNESECVIVDAGAKVEDVAKTVGVRKVLGVFLTHGHYDHAFFVLDYAKKFGCKIYGSEFLEEYLKNPDHNYSEGTFKIEDFSDFVSLGTCGTLCLGGIQIEYKQLGGHSKSDMVFKIGDEIFVGDLLLGRDMGRVDLYGGSKNEMKNSLQFLLDEKFFTMHSGHGEDNDKPTQDKVAKLWLKFLNR